MFVNRHLEDIALSQLLLDPKAGVKTFDELAPGYRATPLSGPRVDEEAPNGSQLMGYGTLVRHEARI